MNFKFLSLLIYLVLCGFVVVQSVCAIIRRWNTDRIGMIVFYILTLVGGVLIAIIGIIKKTTDFYYSYINNIERILLGYLVIFLFQLFYLSVTYKGNRKSKKIILFGWIFMVIPIIFGLILFVKY